MTKNEQTLVLLTCKQPSKPENGVSLKSIRNMLLFIQRVSRKRIGIIAIAIVGFYTVLSLVAYNFVTLLEGNHKDVFDFVDSFQIEQQQQQRKHQKYHKPMHNDKSLPDFNGEDGKRRFMLARMAQNEQAKEIKQRYELEFPPEDTNRIRNYVYQNLRRPYEYETQPNMPYDIYNCPRDGPPVNYPFAWNVMDVLENWNASQTTDPERLFQSICVWDYETDLSVAEIYRNAEVPFLFRNTPSLLQTSERWNRNPEYLTSLYQGLKEKVEHSHNNHFMYFKIPHAIERLPPGWTPPMEIIELSFEEWYAKAKGVTADIPNQERYYFRSKGAPDSIGAFLFEELPIFKAVPNNFFMVQPDQQRGINCRFGMKGVIAETHFDESRNFVVLLGGQRRYILAHPRECPNLQLFPLNHPSGRHSAVDWIHPDVTKFPNFPKAQVHEVVLQAGDALYLPTMWFHFVVSLNVNYQCNARSGKSNENFHLIQQCGFL
jgi:Cupin-like domain